MKEIKLSNILTKKVKKLKGQEFLNVENKIRDIAKTKDITHYKNLKYHLKHFKRVHVNNSYIILFFGEDNIVYFIDYEHHDVVYKKKYSKIKFN